MTTKLSTQLTIAAGVFASALIVANCSRPEPEPPAAVVEAPAPAPVVEPVRRPAPPVVSKAATVTLTTPMLAEKAKDLLSPGTDFDLAVSGFKTPQQFLAVAYAAKNMNVPFVLLKDKVLTRKMSLADAITVTSKYNVNATLEAARAESEARADLARKSGPQ